MNSCERTLRYIVIVLAIFLTALLVAQCTVTICTMKNPKDSSFHVEQSASGSADSASVNSNVN
nr:MAG TPA: hypothetical protein [Microviridae sp.]